MSFIRTSASVVCKITLSVCNAFVLSVFISSTVTGLTYDVSVVYKGCILDNNTSWALETCQNVAHTVNKISVCLSGTSVYLSISNI